MSGFTGSNGPGFFSSGDASYVVPSPIADWEAQPPATITIMSAVPEPQQKAEQVTIYDVAFSVPGRPDISHYMTLNPDLARIVMHARNGSRKRNDETHGEYVVRERRFVEVVEEEPNV